MGKIGARNLHVHCMFVPKYRKHCKQNYANSMSVRVKRKEEQKENNEPAA